MFCRNCGKEIGTDVGYCPYCGQIQKETNESKAQMRANTYTMPQEETVSSQETKTNMLAIVGFVISLISLLLNFWGLVGIAALIVSVVGMIKIGKNKEKGKGFAIAGIIIGTFSVVYGVYTIMFI